MMVPAIAVFFLTALTFLVVMPAAAAPFILRLVLVEVLAPVFFAFKRLCRFLRRKGRRPFPGISDPQAAVAFLGVAGHFRQNVAGTFVTLPAGFEPPILAAVLDLALPPKGAIQVSASLAP